VSWLPVVEHRDRAFAGDQVLRDQAPDELVELDRREAEDDRQRAAQDVAQRGIVEVGPRPDRHARARRAGGIRISSVTPPPITTAQACVWMSRHQGSSAAIRTRLTITGAIAGVK
jgi:hypothetical protein